MATSLCCSMHCMTRGGGGGGGEGGGEDYISMTLYTLHMHKRGGGGWGDVNTQK